MKIVIIGAGGFGREVLGLIKNMNQVKQQFTVLGFLDDGIDVGTEIHDYKVLGNIASLGETEAEGVVISIAKTQIRAQIRNHLPKGINFPNIIHPNAFFQNPENIQMGEGNIICAGNIFTTDIHIGNFNIFNLSCTIGHDIKVEDFCSIMPGVNISGGASLKHGVYVGTGAKLIKATTLGEFCTVGAGAVVDSDIAPKQTVVGVPARPIKQNK